MKTKRNLIQIYRLGVVVLGISWMVSPAAGQTSFVVTNASDSGPGTLRTVIANATNGTVITFDPSLSGQVILLTNGLINLTTNLTIDASVLTSPIQINGNHASSIFTITAGNTVTLNSLTITNGYVIFLAAGGINNQGTLTLTNCTLSGNSVTNGTQCGGAIYNQGTLMLASCTLTGNSVKDVFGSDVSGAIFNVGGGMLTLRSCTLSGNSVGIPVFNAPPGAFAGCIYANGFGEMNTLINCTLSSNSVIVGADDFGGGAIVNLAGALTLISCTLSENSATNINSGISAGGIYNHSYGTMTLTCCTLSGNSVTNTHAGGSGGGGIYNNGGTLTLTNCTLTGNTFTYSQGNNAGGGGIYNGVGTVTLFNSIVANNVSISNAYASTDIHGTYVNNGTNFIGGDPLLGPLGNYGGFTPTMPPLPGSPVIDAGSDDVTNIIATDQRGFPRLEGLHVDIGALELPTLQFAANPTNAPVGYSVQFTCPSVDSDGSTITQWHWNFNDSGTSTVQNPSHVYNSAGSFSTSLTVTNNLGITLAASGPAITLSPVVLTGISLAGTDMTINGSNGVFGMTYYVLMTTNLELPVSQWTLVSTNMWNVDGNFSLTVTNAVNPLVPEEFYLLNVK